MQITAFSSQCCAERPKWNTPRVADAAAVVYLFDTHPVHRHAVERDTVPTDPPPTRLGHRPFRV